MKIWQKNPELRSVAIAAALFWVICTGLVLWRFYNFFPSDVSFDQGIFNQVFWNSLHGRFFQSSLSSTESSAVIYDGAVPDVVYQRLAQHFTPTLMLWLPFYALFQSPAGLSILQVTLITLAGFVLYALARHYHPPHLSALITISYYCANAVIGPTVANFHDFSQIPLYIFGLLLALERRWWWLFVILSALTLAVREDAGIILFGIGIYLIASRRFPRIGVGLCVASVIYVVTITNMVMPSFASDIGRRFMVEQYGQFVQGIENPSTLDVLKGILQDPVRTVRELVTPPDRTLSYFLGYWVPLAFIPSISMSAWLLAGVPLFNILIQNDPDALSLQLRYALAVVPGLFYGTILWWSKHPLHFKPWFRRFWVVCLGFALLFTLTSNPNRAFSVIFPDSFQPWVYVSPARQLQHSQAIRQLIAQIPPDASVSATGHIVSHLSNRREVVRFPELRIRGDDRRDARVKYIITDLWYPLQYQPAFFSDWEFLRFLSDRITRITQTSRYQLIDFRDGVALLQWGAEPNPEAVATWQQFYDEIKPIIQASRSGVVDG
ncbi:DUF2079 domain-containing protein [Oscillatoria sp. FACHB-1407]|uniref:DUF2079 domain-containing protein n=1 Tax=Oscillatoria sp. FACHB-1407 TaxID=2692847 RepID=UPI00168456BB|nr:DUF2079 domain-containing protein [Oscillatoria sp. FACHB-1407]MBD2463251.1 DUF2079 domain-containing protein [Oscillatoria sp. FACHB-1407]